MGKFKDIRRFFFFFCKGYILGTFKVLENKESFSFLEETIAMVSLGMQWMVSLSGGVSNSLTTIIHGVKPIVLMV